MMLPKRWGGSAVERDEFEKVYWALHPKLLAYARGQLDEASAYDVTASAFETLWKKNLTFPTDDSDGWRRLTSLAFEVLKGHVRNEYRSRRRRIALWRRAVLLGSSEEATEDSSIQIDDAAAAREWLSQLSQDDRHVIALFNAGYSTDEMADILRCSPAAAARRRDRAKDRLRAIVARDGGERP